MVELIAAVILIGSAAGLLSIVARRMPSAKQASEGASSLKMAHLWMGLKSWIHARIKKTPYFKDFSWLDFLQKQLLKVRVLTLKTENKINDYTVRLRQHAENQQKKDETFFDNYWHDLKTIVKTKKLVPIQKNSDTLGCIGDNREKSSVFKVTNILPAESMIEKKSTEMTIGRVVMPEAVAQKPFHQKKRHQSKKKKFKDPFQW
jgi:hypothetical protein